MNCRWDDIFMKVPMSLGERVAYVRQERGMSQEDLCQVSGVSTQKISAIENGRGNTRTDTVVNLANGLQISTDYLLRGIPTTTDISDLEGIMSKLTCEQYHNLQEIIKNYCAAVGVGITNND